MSAALLEKPAAEEKSGWTPEARAEGRRKGAQSRKATSAHIRVLWLDHIVRMFIDAFTFSRTWPTRQTIIEGLKAFNFDHRLEGKGGGQIKTSTISKFVTEELLTALQVQAIEDLLKAERLKAERQQSTE